MDRCRTVSSILYRTVFCLASFLLLLSPLPVFASRDTVPDWVHTAMARSGATYPPQTKAVVLLDDTSLTVSPDGKAVEHHRYVVKILRPNGRNEGIFQVGFDKDTKILSLHVWSVAPDGHEYAVKDSEVSERSYAGEAGELFDDTRYKYVEPPGRDPGGVIAWEYEQRLAPYLKEDDWSFQDDLPRVSESFTLELPAGYSYGTNFAHHEPLKAIDLEHGRYRWEMNNEPGIDLNRVPMRPSLGALAGRMSVYFAPSGSSLARLGTWQGVGEWYDSISHDRFAATPEIAAKARELTAGKTDFYDKTEAIALFMQKQIRYFVVERGVGGWQPHPAGEIFRNRYGDCKDKATLLSAMLSSVGIHSVIVLVDTRRGLIDPKAPSIFGDHAIAAVEIPEGYNSPKLRSVSSTSAGKRYLIFDPTWIKTPFGQLESGLQGSYGTLVDGDRSEIIALPVLDPQLNTVRRTAHLQLAADGTIKGSIVEKRFGDLAEDDRFVQEYGNEKQQRQFLDTELGRDFFNFNVTGLKVENAGILNQELSTSFDLAAERYSRTAGSLLMVRPRVLGSEGMELDHKTRTVPIDLEQTMTASDDFTIELPAGYSVDEIPEPVKLDVGFAAYQSATTLVGSTLHYTRTYTVRAVTVPASRYGDLQKLAGVISNDEQNQAVFKKMP